MNKLITLSMLALIVFTVGVMAEGSEDAPKGIMDENESQVNPGDGAKAVAVMAKTNAQDVDAVREQLQERQQVMEQEMQNMGTNTQKAYQNQNEVRLAVHALHALGNMTGSVGPQISEMAKQFNNSVQATIRAEERIEKKSGFARFFSGGDKEAGEELATEATMNQERVQELKQLKEQCDCDEAVKEMLQEQIQSMEQEQTRLQELATKEQKKKGLLGWIWK